MKQKWIMQMVIVGRIKKCNGSLLCCYASAVEELLQEWAIQGKFLLNFTGDGFLDAVVGHKSYGTMSEL
jgi:hypothetical protein